MIVSLAAAGVAAVWTLVRPLGPVGNWQAKGSTLAVADPTILTRFDPFFRAVATGPVAVTGLNLKLFGTRLDQAMGRGSAIIQTPDNIQSSFGVGDEIVPGVVLKSVAFDSVTIDRGGTSEQLFLDQSVPAAQAAAAGALPPAGTAAVTPAALMNVVNFSPRLVNGAVSGFTLTPKGPENLFAATGLQTGDVVTQINGTPIQSMEQASSALAAGGATPTLTVERGGRTITVAPGSPK